MIPSEVNGCAQLEEVDNQLKGIVADLTLDKATFQNVVGPKIRALPGDANLWMILRQTGG